MNSVQITRKGEARLESGHPWIFASDVADRGAAQPGEAVRVTNQRGRFLGIAHYSSTSQITLRLLSRTDEPLTRDFFFNRLQSALNHRRRVAPEATSYRLVHAEGDLLPGLIIDRYGDYLVLQLLNQGMDAIRHTVTDCLTGLLAPKGIIARNDVPVRRLEALSQEPAILAGEIPDRVPVSLNHLTLHADLRRGQKTGVYLDQRENYLAAARFARGRALDCFTSTGGFALHLAAACESVEAVDSSPEALSTAQSNAQSNSISNITFREANAFDYLSGLATARRQFDTIILDPPAFAKSRTTLDAALRGYKEINYKALKLLPPGGTLVTCSCSHHVSESSLFEVVAEAALDARRTLRVLDRRTQAQDHPILLTVPETLYLKCLILEVL